MNGAETNLARLDDVLQTLEAQLEGLKKQARQAARYRRLSDHIRRAEAAVQHLRWLAASAELTVAEERLRAAERVVAERTTAASAAERNREAVSALLPALRQAEAVAAAELQRLTLARQGLEEEERRLTASRLAAEARLEQLAADLKREDELAGDAKTALARLEEERDSLRAAQEQEQAVQLRAAEELARVTGEVASLDAELTQLTERVASDEARRTALGGRVNESSERQRRLKEREGELARQRAALEAEAAASAVSPEIASALRAAEDAADQSREAVAAAEQALAEARASENQARAPLEQAEMRRAKLRAEGEALEKMLAGPAEGRWPPIIDALQVAHGYEAALGAALGEDLTAPVDETAPSYWVALADYTDAPGLPGGVAPLANFVTAPAALARRLHHLRVPAAGSRAQLIPNGRRYR